jgi:hypothetical protein
VAAVVLASAGTAAALAAGGGSGPARVVVGSASSLPGHSEATIGVAPGVVTLNAAARGGLLPSGTFMDRRVARPIAVDRGALRIDPPPMSQSPVVPFEQANAIVNAARSYDQGIVVPADIGFGIVYVNDAFSAGLPPYSGRSAWVAVLAPPPSGGADCVAGGGAVEPRAHVVIIDAETGDDVLDYQTRGTGPCGGIVNGPTVQRAQEITSLAWIGVGQRPVTAQQTQRIFPPGVTVPAGAVNWVLRSTIPPCGSITASGVDYPSGLSTLPALYVDAQVPIDQPSSCPPAKTVTTTLGPENTPISQVQHAPTGITASGN